MSVLSHVLSVAVREWEWLEVNAAHRLRKLKEPRGRDRFLSEGECARLLEVCKTSSNPNLHDVVLLAISTGMRRNEILSLRFNQLDVARGMIYLYDTKNGERRGVPLAGAALESMRKRAHVGGGETELIFAGKTKVTPFDIRKPWYAALGATGLQDVRFHDLRHTAASFLAKGGGLTLRSWGTTGSQVSGHDEEVHPLRRNAPAGRSRKNERATVWLISSTDYSVSPKVWVEPSSQASATLKMRRQLAPTHQCT
jgi:integrase